MDKVRTPPRNDDGLYGSFRHYITGVVYYAKDYGHRCWPIGRRKK